jgi:hypothetical protein
MALELLQSLLAVFSDVLRKSPRLKQVVAQDDKACPRQFSSTPFFGSVCMDVMSSWMNENAAKIILLDCHCE